MSNKIPPEIMKILLNKLTPEEIEILVNAKGKKEIYGRYKSLKIFLESLPQQYGQLELSFSDFEKITGHKLPESASKHRPWWANTTSHPHSAAWSSAGWEIENIYLKAKIAVFRRKGGNLLKDIPEYLKVILDGSYKKVRPKPAHELVKWISFCRRVGWYFEGKVLYERGGLMLDTLNETERTEVDEDYSVCKKELMRYRNEKNV